MAIAIELGVDPMALRILILACSLTVPAARSSQRDAVPVPVDDIHLLPGKSSDTIPADGHFRPLVGCEELLCPLRSLPDRDDEEGEDGANPYASAALPVAGIDPSLSPPFPTHPCPRAARFSSWRPPLRC